MIQRHKKAIIAAFLLAVIVIAFVIYFIMNNTDLSKKEEASLKMILGNDFSKVTSQDISEEVLNGELKRKFPAVKKVYRTDEEKYAFICKPVGYNGEITLAVAIDGKTNKIMGLKIVDHVETPEYVRDMESDWFTGRFGGKSIDTYLELSRLEEEQENDIIMITGATITTQGVVNGANAAMGVYREYVLKQNSAPVPLKVEIDESNAISQVKENGKVKITDDGATLGAVTIDEIREMPDVKRRIVINSSQGASTHDFRGTLLINILNSIDSSLVDQYESAVIVGADGYQAEISMEEIKQENKVYLMYADGEKPLAMLNGESGSMRIVILGDDYGQRFTNYLVEIQMKGKL